MKKNLFIISSLTLGLALASCQNDVNEPILTDEVQNELASTRADEGISENDIEAAMLQAASAGLSISGSRIISGTNTVTYTVSATDINVSSYYIDWDYNTSVLSATAGGDGNTTITLKLSSSTNTSDTYLRVYLRESSSSGAIAYGTSISIGCNGPLANTSSVRVVRSSDGVEVYPATVGLSPDTWYYAYFTNTQASNMTLEWVFNHATVYDKYGYTAYFKTDSTGWSFLTVNGKMSGSSVYKYMLGVTLYGGTDTNSIGDEETDEESEDIIEDE